MLSLLVISLIVGIVSASPCNLCTDELCCVGELSQLNNLPCIWCYNTSSCLQYCDRNTICPGAYKSTSREYFCIAEHLDMMISSVLVLMIIYFVLISYLGIMRREIKIRTIPNYDITSQETDLPLIVFIGAYSLPLLIIFMAASMIGEQIACFMVLFSLSIVVASIGIVATIGFIIYSMVEFGCFNCLLPTEKKYGPVTQEMAQV